MNHIFTDIELKARDEIVNTIKKWKVASYIEMPSEWAEQNRNLPPGVSNLPGKIDHSVAPHMVEIQDCFHPDSGIKQVTIMKSTQSLATTTVENVIGWAIKNKLHNILYIIASKSMAKMRSSAAIDVLIDYSGLQEYVKPISTRMKHKTADNTFYKELAGGRRLMMTSYNSIADAKSFSWDLIIFDELTDAPYELKGQGDPEKIFEGRGKTARHLKMAKLSTPDVVGGRIHTNFLEGDQRFFYCQCPLCGELQVLELKAQGRTWGLTARSETIDGIEQIVPASVEYICKFCEQKIYEHHKKSMLMGGKWIPTARPVNTEYRSYHISNLMSPVTFYSWERIMQEFCETEWGGRVTRFKNFVIDVLGMPWESRSEKKKWTDLKAQADKYQIGYAIPAGGLVITGGADVQKNRIELQVVAWGRNMASWVVDYQIFNGETCIKNGPVWQDFYNYVMTKKYEMDYKGKKIKVPIAVCAVDSGYNPKRDAQDTDINTEHIVYEFVARNKLKFFSVRGNDSLHDVILKEERVKRKSPLKTRYDVAVSDLKDEIFTKIDLSEDDLGRMHFSQNLADEYFKGFCSEVFKEVAPGKWAWDKVHERNEPLDTWIYSRAGAEKLNLPSWAPVVWDSYEKKLFAG